MGGGEDAVGEDEFDDFPELPCRVEAHVLIEFPDETVANQQAPGEWQRQSDVVVVVAEGERAVPIGGRQRTHAMDRRAAGATLHCHGLWFGASAMGRQIASDFLEFRETFEFRLPFEIADIDSKVFKHKSVIAKFEVRDVAAPAGGASGRCLDAEALRVEQIIARIIGRNADKGVGFSSIADGVADLGRHRVVGLGSGFCQPLANSKRDGCLLVS